MRGEMEVSGGKGEVRVNERCWVGRVERGRWEGRIGWRGEAGRRGGGGKGWAG